MNDIKMTNNKLLIPFVVTLIGAVFMFITIFLPYGTANEEQAEKFRTYPDEIVYEEVDMTSKDMINISMVEYANVYGNLSEQIWGDTSYGIFYIALVALIGVFSLLSVLFSVLKKPIAVAIFSLLAFGVFCIQNFDYTDRGVIPSSTYEWGAAYYVFYIAFVVALVGAIWMLVSKIIQKKQQKQEN